MVHPEPSLRTGWRDHTEVFRQLEYIDVDKLSISSKSSGFGTPWFELVGKSVGNDAALYYSISMWDYVSVFAVTRNGKFALVRQFHRGRSGHAGIAVWRGR